MSEITVDKVNQAVSPIIRKYDWHTKQIKNGVKLSVSDGEKVASVNITQGENIETEAKRLIAEVDKHNFVEME